MANHVIQQVRDALMAALTVPPLVDCANVFLYRDRPQDVSKTPFIYIQTGADNDTDQSIGYPTLEDINVTLTVSIVVNQTGDYEAKALTIRKQIENVLYPATVPNTLGNIVLRLQRISGTPDQDDSGAKPTYAIHLDVLAQIRHRSNQPDSFIY